MAEKVRGKQQEAEWPVLSEKERDRRWSRVRELMKARGVECLVVFGLKGREQFDRYLTNDRTGGVTIFPLVGEMTYLATSLSDVVGHLESTLRSEASWVKDIRFGPTGAKVMEVLKEKGYERANIGVVGISIYGAGEREGYVPYTTWANILKGLPQAKFHEVSNDFAQVVAIKSDEEIALVRKAAQIGELASEAMMKATRPGVPESEIYTAVMSTLSLNRAQGSASPYISPLILHSGRDNPSWNAPMWLFRPQPPRVMEKGDVVQAEIFPRYGGMEAQIQMSVAIAPVDPMNKQCATMARQAYEAGIKALRPGKTFGEVVAAMEEPIKQVKDAWFLSPLIHSLNPLSWVSKMGIGIEKLPGIEKYKGIAPTPNVGGELVIQPNTVWVIEPNACLGKYRVILGGTVILTKDGPISLNTLSTEMRVVG